MSVCLYSQGNSCRARNVLKLRTVTESLHNYSHVGKGLNDTECARALNSLKDKAEGNNVVNIYSRECLGKSRYKLFGGGTPSQMLIYRQTCLFHQDHVHCSDVKGGDDSANDAKKNDSKKHKQMVR